MSRAFVRESDVDPGQLPDRPSREAGESVPFQGVEAEIVSIEP